MRFIVVLMLAGLACGYMGEDLFWKKASALDFVGIWVSEDGAMLDLRNNGTCYVSGLNLGRLSDQLCYEEKKVCMIGKWNYNDFFARESQVAAKENKIIVKLDIRDKHQKVVNHSFVLVTDKIFLWEKETPEKIEVDSPGKLKYEFKRWTGI